MVDAYEDVDKNSFDEKKKKHPHVLITSDSPSKQIRTLLGDNYIGTRRCGRNIELITVNPLTDKELKEVKKIWRKSE